MSLLAHRVSNMYLVPTQISTAQGVGSGTTYTITPAVTPTDGNFLVITVGGTQTRVIVTPPTGFTEIATVTTLAGTNKMFYKVASSEPASYSIVWGLALGGGWTFTELTNIENSSPLGDHVGGETALGTSVALSAYDVDRPGFTITCLSKSLGGAWGVDNSFINVNPSGSHKAARRRYVGIALGEATTWTGTNEQAIADLVVFKGRRI
jgi:hypothetical protein